MTTTIPAEEFRDTYTLRVDPVAAGRADALARGCYQAALLDGREAWSGATLRGAARQWGGKYARSRAALLARLTAAGIPWCEVRASHGKRCVVIGANDAEVRDAR